MWLHIATNLPAPSDRRGFSKRLQHFLCTGSSDLDFEIEQARHASFAPEWHINDLALACVLLNECRVVERKSRYAVDPIKSE
jgi:hypothetical protein